MKKSDRWKRGVDVVKRTESPGLPFLFEFRPTGDSEAGHVKLNWTKQSNWHTRLVTWNTFITNRLLLVLPKVATSEP